MAGPPSASPTGFDRSDFHCHTFLTDGRTSATEMWRYAQHLGHRVLAVTDHVGAEDPGPLLARLSAEAKAWVDTGLIALVGVEITHVPPRRIPAAVRAARRAGAQVVIVHGETIAEPVAPGTNRAALEAGEVDILAHPGLLSAEEAALAAAHDVLIEISGRRAHGIANGHVARVALEAGAAMVVDSDAHAPGELLPSAEAARVALAAGLTEPRLRAVLEEAPRRLLRRLGERGTAGRGLRGR